MGCPLARAADSTLNLTGNVSQFVRGSLRNTLQGGTWIVNSGATLNLEGRSETIGLSTGSIVLRGKGKFGALPTPLYSNEVDLNNSGQIELQQGANFHTSDDFENNGILNIDQPSSMRVNGQFETNDGSTTVIRVCGFSVWSCYFCVETLCSRCLLHGLLLNRLETLAADFAWRRIATINFAEW